MDQTCQHTLLVIQNELDRQNMSQRQLALKAGIKPSSLSRVMTGKSIPTVEFLGKLAHALGTQVKISLVPADTADPTTR